jgi:hypothetical protein
MSKLHTRCEQFALLAEVQHGRSVVRPLSVQRAIAVAVQGLSPNADLLLRGRP